MDRKHLSFATAPKSSPSPRIGMKRKGSVHPSLANQAASLEQEVRECCDSILAPCWAPVEDGGVSPTEALALVAKGLGILVPDESSEEEVRNLLVTYVTSRGGSEDAAEAVVERAKARGQASLEEALAKRNREISSGLQAQQTRFGMLLHELEEVRYQVLNNLVRPAGKKSTRMALGSADTRQGWLDGILCRENVSVDDLREYARILASRRDSLQDRAKKAKTLEGVCSLSQRAQDTILLLKEVYARIRAIKKGEDRIPQADQDLTVQDLIDRLTVQDLV